MYNFPCCQIEKYWNLTLIKLLKNKAILNTKQKIFDQHHQFIRKDFFATDREMNFTETKTLQLLTLVENAEILWKCNKTRNNDYW